MLAAVAGRRLRGNFGPPFEGEKGLPFFHDHLASATFRVPPPT